MAPASRSPRYRTTPRAAAASSTAIRACIRTGPQRQRWFDHVQRHDRRPCPGPDQPGHGRQWHATPCRVVGGSGNLTVNGGRLILGTANTLVGVTTIPSGTLQLNNPLAIQGQTLDINTTDAGTLDTSTASLTSLTLGGLMGSRNFIAPAGPLTVGGNGVSTTYSGNLSGATSLTKVGSGTLYLSGANSAGSTIVSGGMLEAATTACRSAGRLGQRRPRGRPSPCRRETARPAVGAIPRSAPVDQRQLGQQLAALGLDTTNGNLTYAGNITLPLGVTKLGTNSLTLTAASPYGPLTVGAGTVASARRQPIDRRPRRRRQPRARRHGPPPPA